MAEQTTALSQLSTRLCPWLVDPLEQLESARQREQLAHAWLIKGTEGIGKINLALVFAQRVLEEVPTDTEPDLLDATTAGVAFAGRHALANHDPDLYWLHPEEGKRSIGIDRIRTIIDALGLKSFRGGNKVVVVEPAESMTSAAANALLKTLEEPTQRTFLLLVSHQPGRLLATLRSRCQSLVVRCPNRQVVKDWLGADEASVHEALLAGGGAPLRVLELIKSGEISYLRDINEALHKIANCTVDAQDVAAEWFKKGLVLPLEWLIAMLRLSIRRRLASGDSVTDSRLDALHNAWQTLSVDALFDLLERTEQLLDQLGTGKNTELALRVLLLDMHGHRERQ